MNKSADYSMTIDNTAGLFSNIQSIIATIWRFPIGLRTILDSIGSHVDQLDWSGNNPQSHVGGFHWTMNRPDIQHHKNQLYFDAVQIIYRSKDHISYVAQLFKIIIKQIK